jgi:predicted nucleic acid-binding protein
MVVLLWDASALAKRYVPELGSDTVDALFNTTPRVQMVSSSVSYAEIYSILLRTVNRGVIKRTAFSIAKSSMRAELIDDPNFVLLSIRDEMFYRGIALIERHNLNATDSALLVLFKSYLDSVRSENGVNYVLVASDQRLVRDAIAEGITAINPEMLQAADVAGYLSAL